MPKTITQMPLATAPNGNYVVLSDNSSGTVTEKLTVQQINDLSRVYPIANLGTITTNTAINFGADKLVQTLVLNGTSVTFSKGTGWPSTSTIGADIILKITALSSTVITWNSSLVNEWYNQLIGAVTIGTHIFLLRANGSVVEGHYIGQKTN